MASVFDKIAKRSAFKVTIGGEDFHVREPSFKDIARAKAVGDSLAIGITLGLCMVNEDGSRCFDQGHGETDSAFAARVQELAETSENFTPSALQTLLESCNRLAKPVSQESLAKN